MPSTSTWQRVTKRRQCPVCGKADWCLYTGDPSNPHAAICARIESPKRCGEGGWLHALRDDGPTWAPWRRSVRVAVRTMGAPANNTGDIDSLAADFRKALDHAALGQLAVSLELSVVSLHRLRVGWSPRHCAWSFPMSDAAGKVLGIRLRLASGKKLSIKGGREGLFVPENLDQPVGVLLVAEGPSDTVVLAASSCWSSLCGSIGPRVW